MIFSNIFFHTIFSYFFLSRLPEMLLLVWTKTKQKNQPKESLQEYNLA